MEKGAGHMQRRLRWDIAQGNLTYQGRHEARPLDENERQGFNHRHRRVLGFYRLELRAGTRFLLEERVNGRSNLGVFRNRQLREAVLLAAALPAAAVVADGFASLRERAGKELLTRLKRHNDRTAAQVMSEVLQLTAESFPVGEEVVIQSAVTEGVRAKPGVEPGGNPTVPVGALFGKEEHCRLYGHGLTDEVTRLSMGSDVIDGTTKSVLGAHSALTGLFVTETNFKRHLPDVYVERWMAGVPFAPFNPRDVGLEEGARWMARAQGRRLEELTAYFLDRPRHLPAMDRLNAMGVATPHDVDGDLFPAVILGLEGLCCPDGRGFGSMMGEIGGSAEWAVGALPLLWRGGESVGLLTSQSALTRAGASPERLWSERFAFTEEELILLSDARFEQKPFFTMRDLAEAPLAGGVAAFCAISDNLFLPLLRGAKVDRERELVTTHTLAVNSLGQVEHWELRFACVEGLAATLARLRSPKQALVEGGAAGSLLARVRAMLGDEVHRFRLRTFFVNEYYPAIIHVNGKMAVLERTVEALIQRGALSEHDRAIVRAVLEAEPGWFMSAV